jgi:paraquat-inducible protein B
MPRQQTYYKLGLFILIGVGLLLAGLLLLGSRALFQSTITTETYFDESVQGLDVGAPVKFRGVTIGRVSKIGFIPSEYPTTKLSRSASYVYVEMELNEDIVTSFGDPNVLENMQRIIEMGLRIRLTTQGLTGVAFLEINFVDPRTNPMLEVPWDPKYIYIPSAPSTLSRVEEALHSISKVLQEFETIDFQEFAQTLQDFIDSLDQALQEANVEDIGELVVLNLDELHKSISRVNELLDTEAAERIIPDVAETAASARRVMQSSEKDLIAAIDHARGAARSLESSALQVENLLGDAEIREGVAAVPEVARDVQAAVTDIRKSTVQLDRLLRNLNDLVQNERGDVEAILTDTRILLRNLNELVGAAKANPSSLLFGQPPEKIDPEALP